MFQKNWKEINRKKESKGDFAKGSLLILMFLATFLIIIASKAYLRPFQQGGPFYEPQAPVEQLMNKKVEYTQPAEIVAPAKPQQATISVGVASWYDYSLDGIEWSDSHSTCASRTATRYSTITVINLANGKSVDCFVNDYGPEAWTGREVDLSSFAFSQIADLSLGVVDVNIVY